jgi:hypothetical protein
MTVFFKIIIIKLILLKIRVSTAKLQIYEWQRAAGTGAEQTPVLVAHFLPINNTLRLFVSHKHIALQLPQTQTDQISNLFISLK